VAGAGPAGCAAAVAARRAAAGLRVVVVDAARFPRDKPCAGALTGGALRELALAGLELRVARVTAAHAVLRVGGRALRVELSRPTAVVRRLELDHDLVRQARAAGVEVLEEAALTGLAPGAARTAQGPIRFRALVVADGVAGPGRRALGLPPGRRAPLREARVPAAPQPDLVFDLDAVAGGYAWRFPCEEAGRAAETCGAYALLGGGGSAVDAGLRRFAARERLAPGAPVSWALRAYDPAGPFGAGGALLAGDALGADPLAAEGLRYALWSGRIAGALAAAAVARGARPSLARYRAALRASRSGFLLELCARLAPRLHGGSPRWRRAAGDRAVAEAVAALVSGEAPLRPLLAVALRLPACARAPGPA
jgi:flavin-dependent dehydrogenase